MPDDKEQQRPRRRPNCEWGKQKKKKTCFVLLLVKKSLVTARRAIDCAAVSDLTIW